MVAGFGIQEVADVVVGVGGGQDVVGGVVQGFIATDDGENRDECNSQIKTVQDSVPKPRSRALCHSRPVVNSCPNWHKTAIRVPAN